MRTFDAVKQPSFMANDQEDTPSIAPQWLLALTNTYVVHTAELLNDIAINAELRLHELHKRYCSFQRSGQDTKSFCIFIELTYFHCRGSQLDSNLQLLEARVFSALEHAQTLQSGGRHLIANVCM